MPVELHLAQAEGGTVLTLNVSARSARNRVLCVHDGALKIAVRAAPERGKANRAVLVLLAKTLAVPARDLEILSGATSRRKRVLVRGETPEEVRRRLPALL